MINATKHITVMNGLILVQFIKHRAPIMFRIWFEDKL